jgi:hypothetical protein
MEGGIIKLKELMRPELQLMIVVWPEQRKTGTTKNSEKSIDCIVRLIVV